MTIEIKRVDLEQVENLEELNAPGALGAICGGSCGGLFCGGGCSGF